MTRLLPLLLCAFPLLGQSWDPVRTLPSGARVKVRETSGIEHKGTVSAVTAEAITVATSHGSASVDRVRVARVQVHRRGRRPRNIAIGAGVGLAVAITLDQTLGAYLRNETNHSGRPITYIAPIALFGALGAAISPYKTIYRLP